MIERIPEETVKGWIQEFIGEMREKGENVPSNISPIILAMVSKESTFNPRGPRFEKNYEWIFNADFYAKRLGISRNTEIAFQSFSYGLLQIMGANCRKLGFDGYLFDLCTDYKTAFKFGARFFVQQLDRYKGNVEKALAAYNAGSVRFSDGKMVSQGYVDDVLMRASEFEKTA